jgi:hypothetical protein
MSRELLKQALEAVERLRNSNAVTFDDAELEDAIRAHLDTPEQDADKQLATMTQERDHYKEMDALHIQSLGLKSEQLAASQAREAALRKDAERYRWIRNNDYLSVMDNAKWEYLDAAIDAVMKEAQS